MSSGESSDSEDYSSEEEVEKAPVPRVIRGTSEFSDICFHPSSDQKLVAGDMHGYVRIYSCVPEKYCVEEVRIKTSKLPVRCVALSTDGEDVLVMTKDKTLQVICASTGATKRKMDDVHSSSPYSMAVIDRNLLASGDEDGVVKLWDLRRGDAPVLEESQFSDYVSEIAVDDNRRLLFAVSGDGTMASYHVRQRKLIVPSKNEECELLCVKAARHNMKLLVGTSNGNVLLYNWLEFAAPSDSFQGHPGPVESMAKVSEDVFCTASSDGAIRAIHVLPNKFIGVVGRHRGLPVEKIRTSHDGDLLASISHDSTIRFWDVGYLKDMKVDARAKTKYSSKFKKLGGKKHGGFLADIDNSFQAPVCDVDSDDVSSDDDSPE